MFPQISRSVVLDIVDQAGTNAMEELLKMCSCKDDYPILQDSSSTASSDSMTTTVAPFTRASAVEEVGIGLASSPDAPSRRRWWSPWLDGIDDTGCGLGDATETMRCRVGAVGATEGVALSGAGFVHTAPSGMSKGSIWMSVEEGPLPGFCWGEHSAGKTSQSAWVEEPENGGVGCPEAWEGLNGVHTCDEHQKLQFLERMFEDYDVRHDVGHVLTAVDGDVDSAVEKLLQLTQEVDCGGSELLQRGYGDAFGFAVGGPKFTQLKQQFPGVDDLVAKNMLDAANGDYDSAAAWLSELVAGSEASPSQAAEDDIDWKVEQLKEQFPAVGKPMLKSVLLSEQGDCDHAVALLNASAKANVASEAGIEAWRSDNVLKLEAVKNQAPSWRPDGTPPVILWKARILRVEFDYEPTEQYTIELLKEVGGDLDTARVLLRRNGFKNSSGSHPVSAGYGPKVKEKPLPQHMPQDEFEDLYERQRKRAQELGNKKAQLFKEASAAYKRGDKSLASTLAQQVKLPSFLLILCFGIQWVSTRNLQISVGYVGFCTS